VAELLSLYRYEYQITLNSTNGCGGADKWADFASTEEVFCPAGYHCPTTTSKVNCSPGHFCKLGSTTQQNCIIKGSCKENEENENIIILGACLVVNPVILFSAFHYLASLPPICSIVFSRSTYRNKFSSMIMIVFAPRSTKFRHAT
jgi:hypothetical protein